MRPELATIGRGSDAEFRDQNRVIKIMSRNLSTVSHWNRARTLVVALVAITFLTAAFTLRANAQDQDQNQNQSQDQDDPPSRVARLGYMEGSVSFQPAGETEWVQAVPNRPMTTGDKLWADKDSRAEVQLGSASIDLSANTGFSFLNLDDHTVQIELSSGTINFRVRGLDRDDVFEIDTPNQAFTVSQSGTYRVEASEDGSYSVVTIRDGAGESTGNGQSYTLHAGQRTTFSGTDSLNAEVQQIGNPDAFDNWSYARDHRYDNSPSARYVSRDVVGFEDLDDNGDWRPSPQYGQVWYPRVAVGWAPYHDGHWAWIDPWGWTWVDDARWGYAPFHYGRWVSMRGRWGWIPGPREVHPVYAPALVVFVGGGGIAIGGNMAWFPLGPREVYVPSYRVSRGYVNRVNVSNTTVNTTTITNVYNTTIINKTTNITNVTYVNRNVRGAVTAVPRQAFVSAQPVGRAAVRVNAREFAAGPVSSRAAVSPERAAVLGVHAGTANRVAAPPRAVANRAVIARAPAPPPRPSFAAKQQMLEQHPGQAVARQEMRQMRPVNAPATSLVRQAPPGRPATATPGIARPVNQPVNQPGNQPANQPGNQPAANERPGANPTPGRPQPGNMPAPGNRPETNRPETNRTPPNQPQPNQPTTNRPEPNRPQPTPPATNNRPETPRPENARPEASQPQPNRPAEPPSRNNRPPLVQPENRPEPNRPETNSPQPNPAAPKTPPETPRPENARPDASQPQPNRPEPNRPPNRPESNRPESNRPQPNAQPNQPAPNNRPETPRPENARPDASQPQPNRPAAPPARNDRPPLVQPNNRPQPNRPEPNQPQPNRAQPNRPADQPQNQATPKPQQPKPQTPEEKKRQDEQNKKDHHDHEQKQPPQ